MPAPCNTEKREDSTPLTRATHFSSRLTTILTMAGLAIGLGNVWRFPYMMGQNGGGAFLLLYLVFMVLLAIPALSCEWALGRNTQSGPIGALRAAFGPRAGKPLALLFLFAAFVATTYYSLVVGNVAYSAWFALTPGFQESTLPQYSQGLGDAPTQYGFGLGIVGLSALVVFVGLKNGIEQVNRILIPVFTLIALFAAYSALRQPGAMDKLLEFITPDFSRVTPGTAFAAMGQASFSVGLSGAMGVVYGSYLRRRDRLLPTAATTGFLDTGAALLASLFVVPTVLVFGLDMAGGPGLLFDTLPRLFSIMPGGRWLGPIFLLAWLLVAVLTIIAAMDTVVTGLLDIEGWQHRRRQLLLGIALLVSMAMGGVAWNPHWIGTLDMIFGNGLFMLGSLVSIIALGWGLGMAKARSELAAGIPPWLLTLSLLWIRFVVPLAIGAILVGYIISVF